MHARSLTCKPCCRASPTCTEVPLHYSGRRNAAALQLPPTCSSSATKADRRTHCCADMLAGRMPVHDHLDGGKALPWCLCSCANGVHEDVTVLVAGLLRVIAVRAGHCSLALIAPAAGAPSCSTRGKVRHRALLKVQERLMIWKANEDQLDAEAAAAAAACPHRLVSPLSADAHGILHQLDWLGTPAQPHGPALCWQTQQGMLKPYLHPHHPLQHSPGCRQCHGQPSPASCASPAPDPPLHAGSSPQACCQACAKSICRSQSKDQQRAPACNAGCMLISAHGVRFLIDYPRRATGTGWLCHAVHMRQGAARGAAKALSEQSAGASGAGANPRTSAEVCEEGALDDCIGEGGAQQLARPLQQRVCMGDLHACPISARGQWCNPMPPGSHGAAEPSMRQVRCWVPLAGCASRRATEQHMQPVTRERHAPPA